MVFLALNVLALVYYRVLTAEFSPLMLEFAELAHLAEAQVVIDALSTFFVCCVLEFAGGIATFGIYCLVFALW